MQRLRFEAGKGNRIRRLENQKMRSYRERRLEGEGNLAMVAS